jgi:hypothetical protein
MLQIKLKPCVELGSLLACHAFLLAHVVVKSFASLKFVWKILSFVWDGLLFHPHLQFGISSVGKLHDPTLTHLFSFD